MHRALRRAAQLEIKPVQENGNVLHGRERLDEVKSVEGIRAGRNGRCDVLVLLISRGLHIVVRVSREGGRKGGNIESQYRS